MNPWIHLDTAQIPGGGELKLMQRGQDYSIMSGSIELMNSRLYGSEVALFKLAWARATQRQAPRILIGGLGMGFTLRAALADLAQGRPHRRGRAGARGHRLGRRPPRAALWRQPGRPRQKIVQGDVADRLAEAKPPYDLILMDVDNGPDGLNRDANDSLYSLHGLTNLKRATKPGGVVAIWSAAPDDKFARRFAHAGFTVTEHKVGAAPSGKGPKHVIWVGVVR